MQTRAALATMGLQQLPHSLERQRQECTLQMMLGPVVMAIKGQAAPEV